MSLPLSTTLLVTLDSIDKIFLIIFRAENSLDYN